MPAVKKNESRQEYISRAMHEMVHNEGLGVNHALGKAEGMYDQHIKKQKGKKK